MKKAILVVGTFAAFAFNVAQAADSFGIGGGFAASVSVSGGSQATSGTNGNGYSNQASNSVGSGYAQSGSSMIVAGGFLPVGFGGIAGAGGYSAATGFGSSQTNSTSNGYTRGDAYGSAKGGAGVDYSATAYSYIGGAYSYAH
jgi:hypothetical protein